MSFRCSDLRGATLPIEGVLNLSWFSPPPAVRERQQAAKALSTQRPYQKRSQEIPKNTNASPEPKLHKSDSEVKMYPNTCIERESILLTYKSLRAKAPNAVPSASSPLLSSEDSLTASTGSTSSSSSASSPKTSKDDFDPAQFWNSLQGKGAVSKQDWRTETPQAFTEEKKPPRAQPSKQQPIVQIATKEQPPKPSAAPREEKVRVNSFVLQHK